MRDPNGREGELRYVCTDCKGAEIVRRKEAAHCFDVTSTMWKTGDSQDLGIDKGKHSNRERQRYIMATTKSGAPNRENFHKDGTYGIARVPKINARGCLHLPNESDQPVGRFPADDFVNGQLTWETRKGVKKIGYYDEMILKRFEAEAAAIIFTIESRVASCLNCPINPQHKDAKTAALEAEKEIQKLQELQKRAEDALVRLALP